MLDKAIQSQQEHRKPYRGAKAISYSCRNHGSCPYCRHNRQIQITRAKAKANSQMQDYKKNS